MQIKINPLKVFELCFSKPFNYSLCLLNFQVGTSKGANFLRLTEQLLQSDSSECDVCLAISDILLD